jgi:hypothetical protein
VALTAVVSELASRARMLRTRTRPARGQPGPTGHGSPSSVSSVSCRVHAGPVRPARRPGALHTGALHAGGAPSCGLGAGVTGVSLAQELRTRSSSSCRLPGLARLVTARKALSPPRRAACSLSLAAASWSSPPWRSPYWRRSQLWSRSCWRRSQLWSRGWRLGTGCSCPADPLFMWAAWPDDHGSPRSASPASCHVHAGPVLPHTACWSSPRRRSPRWRRSQRWPYGLRPGTDLHVGSLARLASAHQALSPSRRAVCTLALCGRSCVLELSALALSMLAALPAVVSELAMLRTRSSSSCRHPGPIGQGSPSSVSSAGCRAHAVPVLPAAAPWSRNWSSPRWRRSELWSWLASRARMPRTRTRPSRG